MTQDSSKTVLASPPAPADSLTEDQLTEDQKAQAMLDRLDKKWSKDAQREYLKLVFGA